MCVCVKDSGPFPEGNEEVVREGSDMTVCAMFFFFFYKNYKHRV